MRFRQFPSQDGADLLGVGQRAQEGQERATSLALGGCAKDLGGTRRIKNSVLRKRCRSSPILVAKRAGARGPPRPAAHGCLGTRDARSDNVPAEGPAGGTEGWRARGRSCRSAGSQRWRGRPCCLPLPSSRRASRPLSGSRCLLNVKALFLLPL